MVLKHFNISGLLYPGEAVKISGGQLLDFSPKWLGTARTNPDLTTNFRDKVPPFDSSYSS